MRQYLARSSGTAIDPRDKPSTTTTTTTSTSTSTSTSAPTSTTVHEPLAPLITLTPCTSILETSARPVTPQQLPFSPPPVSTEKPPSVASTLPASPSHNAPSPLAAFALSLSTLNNLTTTLSQRLSRTSRVGLLLRCATRGVRVGKRTSTTAYPLLCFADRLEYKFVHPALGKVDMIMYFRDARDPSLTTTSLGTELSFHIVTRLALFDDYDPRDENARLTVRLLTDKDAQSFTTKILPLMKGGR